MGLPSPNPSQTQSLQELKAVADAGVQGAIDKEAAIQEAIDKQQDVEDYQKSLFDILNDEIFRRYEIEKRWLNGKDIVSPIVEADLQNFANEDITSRLWNNGNFAPKRIDEFDGIPLVDLETEHELSWFIPQDDAVDLLLNGIVGQILLTPGATTISSINDTSTSLSIKNNLVAISINDHLLISNGVNVAIVKVTSTPSIGGYCTGEDNPPQVTQPTCEADNGTWTVTNTMNIEMVLKPGATIAAGSPVGQTQYNGFNNTERTTKIASDPNLQVIMDNLLDELHNIFDKRITAMQNQLDEVQNNQDDNLPASIETNLNTSISALQGFLGVTPPSTIDVSDTGITAIGDEKAVRQPQATSRPSTIDTALAFGETGTKSYYDVRFETSGSRCRLNNGSINLLKKLIQSKIDAQAGGLEAQALSDRYDNLVP